MIETSLWLAKRPDKTKLVSQTLRLFDTPPSILLKFLCFNILIHDLVKHLVVDLRWLARIETGNGIPRRSHVFFFLVKEEYK